MLRKIWHFNFTDLFFISSGKAGKKYTIIIHPMLPENMFKLSRFGPLKNNVRLSWYNGETIEDPNADYGNFCHNRSNSSECLLNAS